MFDNAAANYTADWVKRTTLLPPEAKVPPELPPDDVNHDSRIMTPKNWGEVCFKNFFKALIRLKTL